MITIGIIDKDHKSRERLISMLEDGSPDQIVGEKPDVFVNFSRDSFDPAAIHADESHPDIVLIDIEGQDKGSIQNIRTHFSETQIIVVSESIDTTTVLETFRNGAANFVQKSSAIDYLFYAIQSSIEDTADKPEFHLSQIRKN